jgi:hypothetical protein
MKIVKNTSNFDTKELKKLFTIVHNYIAKNHKGFGRLKGWNISHINVANKVKGRKHSGCAYVGYSDMVWGLKNKGWNMFLSLNEFETIEQIIQLYAHELYHNYGLEHKDYPDKYNVFMTWELDKIIELFGMSFVPHKKKDNLIKNVVAKNYKNLKARKENLLKRQKQYLSNLKRIENSLKKVDRNISDYEKKYDTERLTVEKIKAPERKSAKTYIHPKQKIEILQKEHDWLFVWVVDEPSYDDGMRIYVLDQSSDLYHYSQYLDSDHYFTTWKTAHEEALRLIAEET